MTTSLPSRDELTTQPAARLTGQLAPQRLRGRGARVLAMTGLSAGLLLAPALTSVAAAQPIPDATSTSKSVGKDDGADLTAADLGTTQQDAVDGTSDDEPTSSDQATEDATSSRERSHKVSTPAEGDDETRTGKDGQAEITVTEDNVDSWWDKIMNWLTGDDDEEQESQDTAAADDPTDADDVSAEDEGSTAKAADADVVRIQTLGDSIIDNDLGGARPALQEKFADVGVSIEWVGSSNESGPTSLSSRATDAHWGESIADMLPDTAAWVKKAHADVIMVSAGGNDLMHDQGEGIKDRWSEYLQTICGANPGVPIVAATNHQLNTKTKAHENELMAEVLNPVIEATDGATVDGGCTVTVVDMDGVISDDELVDDLHPNQDGYADMAAQWFPALRTAINETSTTAGTDTPSRENTSTGEADAADRTAN